MSEPEQITVHTPGPAEKAALLAMQEIDYPTKEPSRHILFQRRASHLYLGYVWSRADGSWIEGRDLPTGGRPLVVAYLAERCAFDNITITDQEVDLEALTEHGLERLDGFLAPGRITLCPEGAPGRPDSWVEINTTNGGAGTISNGNRFSPVQLKERLVKAATPPNPTGQWNPNPLPHFPLLVRHDVAARELLSPRLWGIEGRPDLLARQVDRELAINAAAEEEAARRWKSGDPTPAAQVRYEVACWMEKGWGRAA